MELFWSSPELVSTFSYEMWPKRKIKIKIYAKRQIYWSAFAAFNIHVSFKLQIFATHLSINKFNNFTGVSF